jgi:hypothetical protein
MALEVVFARLGTVFFDRIWWTGKEGRVVDDGGLLARALQVCSDCSVDATVGHKSLIKQTADEKADETSHRSILT